MADLYGYENQSIKTPLTADRATIQWGGIVTGAIDVTVTYAQQITRKRTIGNKDAIIHGSMPTGQISIRRLLTADAGALFGSPGFRACDPGTITVTLGGCTGNGPSFTATGCVVSQYSVQAEAEGLTVMDNVTIEFLQLSAG